VSDFDALEHERAAALAELATVLDLAAGTEDVLRELDRAQTLNVVGDLLDLRSGAAAALDAAGITGQLHRIDAPRTARSTGGKGDHGSPAVASPNVVVGRMRVTLEQIRRVNRIIDELGRVLATDRVYAPALADIQDCLDQLVSGLVEHRLTRGEADGLVAQARELLRVVAREIAGSGYGPRLNGVDHEVLRVQGCIARLFDPSGHAAYSRSDR